MPYSIESSGKPADAAANARALTDLLNEAKKDATDSPLFQLVDGLMPPDIHRLKTDVFRDRVEYSHAMKERLADARNQNSVDAVKSIRAQLGSLSDVESGVLIDLMLSFRAVKAWKEMIALVDGMPEPLAKTVMVREQYALALNREGQSEKAERVLVRLISERGPSSETYGILGRVHKDRWQAARDAGQAALAEGLLSKAIDAYLKGFQSDMRDAYPGINAVTLMELQEPPDERRKEILPVVTYSVRRRIEAAEPDYWDHATLLELAVLGRDKQRAMSALADALAAVREVWEPETTLRNLRLIRETRESRGEGDEWLLDIEKALERAMQK